MNKIPTIFIRDLSKQPALVTTEWHPDCLWVRDGEGIPTVKYDGTSCLVRDGKLYKRRELRGTDTPPASFELVGFDDVTGKSVGWVPVGDGPDDRWHREAMEIKAWENGTYELIGPKVQGNKNHASRHTLIRHGCDPIADDPRTFEAIREILSLIEIEGLVWHHPDGRMAKIKRRDFGLKW
jgi:hypothetical protein